MKKIETKRVFFAFETKAPWPEKFPKGNLLDESARHLTLAFLGDVNIALLQKALVEFPPPPFMIGPCGKFDKCLFFPPKRPRLVAWNFTFLEESASVFAYQKTLSSWLHSKGFTPENKHPFNPHLTICRRPESTQEWEKSFVPLPFILKNLHLYESLGHSQYQPIWTYPIIAPFVEIEHTADIGFEIRGHTLSSLYSHAQVALCFCFPLLIHYLLPADDLKTTEDVVIALNHIVSLADQEIGTPFKAVSFHGKLHKEKTFYRWEMIIDV